MDHRLMVDASSLVGDLLNRTHGQAADENVIARLAGALGPDVALEAFAPCPRCSGPVPVSDGSACCARCDGSG
jgi:hypothetical protein